VRARPVVAGTRYKVTRRCLERRFLLVPDDPRVAQFFGYCLGLALSRFGLVLHAACAMSNHYHLDLTDPHGRLPEFKCMLNAFLARGLNSLRGRFDRFWSEDRPCDVELLTEDDVLRSIAYTVTNPTSAGLVRTGRRWPGFTTWGLPFGSVMRFERPRFFFDADNASKLPDAVEIVIGRPDIRPDLGDDELFGLLMDRVRRRERTKEDKLTRVGQRFMGERKVTKQSWRRRPASAEVRFGARPRMSSSSKWARIARMQRNREWEDAYALAYEAHQRRSRKRVPFPAGTYWMRRFAAVPVASGPP
jgi:REP element-mobilizing transposase RayT